jgi:hypothetical protein
MPLIHKIGVLLLLLFVVACTGKPKKAPGQPVAQDPPKKVTKSSESVAKKTVAKADSEPEPEKETAVASRPDKTVAFLSVDKITDNATLKSLVMKMDGDGHTSKTLRIQFEGLKKFGSVKALIRALRSTQPNTRSQAAKILNRMKHRSTAFTEALNHIVLSDPDPDVRGVIARVMVFYHSKDTVSALSEALVKDGAESVRMHAAWALGAVGDRRGTDALVTALKDGKTNVRLRAVGALKRLNARNSARHIVACLSDKNVLVRDRAHEALRALSGKNFGKKESAWRKLYPLAK